MNEFEKYSAEAEKKWGGTDACKEYARRSKGRSADETADAAARLMRVFAEFGAVKDGSPESPEAAALVEKLKTVISADHYACTDGILEGLGKTYVSDARFTANIDAAGGSGTALFASRAIEAYCRRRGD